MNMGNGEKLFSDKKSYEICACIGLGRIYALFGREPDDVWIFFTTRDDNTYTAIVCTYARI